MNKKSILIIFLQLIMAAYMQDKQPKPIVEEQLTPLRDNPAFVRDRKKGVIMSKYLIIKPEMPSVWTNRHAKPFNPAWMDYCDPYHCNDYHKVQCGLNRQMMKFKYFQSGCHLILNNQCSTYRGFLKYDVVENKYCQAYVMFLRMGCPTTCNDEIEPICAVSAINGEVVLFKSPCAMEAINCRNATVQEFDKVYMSICQYYIQGRLNFKRRNK